MDIIDELKAAVGDLSTFVGHAVETFDSVSSHLDTALKVEQEVPALIAQINELKATIASRIGAPSEAPVAPAPAPVAEALVYTPPPSTPPAAYAAPAPATNTAAV